MRTTLTFFFIFLFAAMAYSLEKEWDQFIDPDFIVYYRNVPPDFVQTVLESAREESKNILENLGSSRFQSWAGNQRVLIYIYDDEEDYIKHGKQVSWSHGAAWARQKIIRTYPSAHGFFDSILPHELGHIIFREVIGVYTEVPLWFEEGVAMYQEKAKRLGAHQMVKEAIKNGQFIPLSKLKDMQLYKSTDEKSVGLFYAESASLVYFMITELGQERFYFFAVN
jgi:hypothetical protein